MASYLKKSIEIEILKRKNALSCLRATRPKTLIEILWQKYTVKIISDTRNHYWMARNFLLGSHIRVRVEFRLLIKQ